MLVCLVTLHRGIKNDVSGTVAISAIAIGASYTGLLALDGMVANGVMNPAIALALALEGELFPAYPSAAFTANTVGLNLIKVLSPLAGGVLAGVMFIF